MQAIIAWVLDALMTLVWIAGAWLLCYAFVLYRVYWERDDRLERVYSVDEFIAATMDQSISLRRLEKMIPHVRRRTIQEVRRLNDAAIQRSPNLLHHVQAADHDPIY